MSLQYKVLLVHNPLSKQPLTWLSYAIRKATNSHWNHAAIEVNLEGRDYIIEAVARGIVVTLKEKWLDKSDRDVLELIPLKVKELDVDTLLLYMGSMYGYVDILYIAKHILLKKIKGTTTIWNGKVPKGWEGIFCSELVAILAKIENPHSVVPGDLEHMSDFKVTNRYSTSKSH
jgi:hypothetical protein